MGRLDTLLALNSAHEASGWRHVDASDVVRALTKACGISPGFGLPREVRGSVLLRALASCKLIPSDAPRAVLISALVVEANVPVPTGDAPIVTERAVFSTNRLVSAVCLLCGGSVDDKIGLCFAACDVDAIKRLSQHQAKGFFAEDAVAVAYAAAYDVIGDSADLQWAIAVWERKLRRFFGGRPGLQSRGDVAMNEEEFKRLASQALDSMSREAVEEAVKDKDLLDDEVFEDAPEQFQSSHRREPSIVESLAMLLKGGEHSRQPSKDEEVDAANRGDRHRRNNSSISANSGETPGLLNLLNNLNSGIKAQHERRRTGSWDDSDIHARHARKPSDGAGGSPLRIVSPQPGGSTVKSPGGKPKSALRKSRSANQLSPVESPVGSTASKRLDYGVETAEEGNQEDAAKRSSGEAGTSVTNETGAFASKPRPRPLKVDFDRSVEDNGGSNRGDKGEGKGKMSKEEMRRAELKAALAAAQEDTELALEGQEDEDNTFESAVAFVQEVGIRMFLYNIVKMLVVIAVIAADACACVWTMFHFGIVIGLSVVMCINVALALLFGFFVIRFNNRTTGQMHMEYGQHMMRGITDLVNNNALKEVSDSLTAMSRITANQANNGQFRDDSVRGGRQSKRTYSDAV